MRFGTNYHLDALRPWTALRGTARDLAGISAAGFDAVRIVGELVLPDEHGDVADLALWHEVGRLCEQNGLAVLALCWNVVSDRALVGHSLEDAAGH
ncbi:MAG TPA: hypothetical protein VMF65_22175, partial [Acidimicrobiales bacterium]|nr:hypothetical protein [Acidimicrobiales bacterium]